MHPPEFVRTRVRSGDHTAVLKVLHQFSTGLNASNPTHLRRAGHVLFSLLTAVMREIGEGKSIEELERGRYYPVWADLGYPGLEPGLHPEQD